MAILPKFVGARIKRREDPALIQGLGQYVDDIPMAGTLHAAFLRSPYAHARITGLHVEAARQHPGVVAVLTGHDILGKVGTIPCVAAAPGLKLPVQHALAVGKVGFVGQPVAVVVAESPSTAQDAVDVIEMDAEPLPAVVDPEQAVQPGASKVHDDFDDNVMFHLYGPAHPPSLTPLGLTDELFRQADKVVSLKITQQRVVPMTMEPRGVLATFDRGRGKLTVWLSTQIPHLVRTFLAKALSMPEHRLQVIAPEVGGGFGAKGQLYPEEILIPYLARVLGRPVKWIERRREHFTSTIHGRGLIEYFDAAVKNDGTLLAVKCSSETTYAQLVADALGVPLDHIEVVHGNTDVVPYGIGTFGSRSLAVGGAALQMSVEKIKDKARQLAAYMLDVRPEDVTYGDGAIYVTADPSRKKTLAEVVFAATDFNWQLQGDVPAGLEPGLEATSRFEPANGTFPFGTHICVVEVDRETGAVELKRYVAVDDCGNVINPLIVDGQVHGGIAQGLAQALYEEVVYDAHGQLVTGSLMDYAVPKAPMLPAFETDRTVTPTLLNPLGAKGIGEAGTIGSAPAVANAIIDALAPFGVKHLEMPFKPEKLWRLMHQGTQA